MSYRLCQARGCHKLVPAGTPRCSEHTKPPRSARGYDTRYDRLRRTFQRRMAAGEVFLCWRCGALIDPARWHLGHDDMDRRVIRGPECPTCNLSAAGRAAHRM